MFFKIFNQQLRVLLWKNFVSKKRQPIITTIEILIPICVAVVIMLIRNLQTNYKMDRCYLKEKQMDSMGPIPFLRDFVCTIKSSCYIQSQINDSTSNTSDFQSFLKNMGSLYNLRNRSIKNLTLLFESNSTESMNLRNAFLYYNNVILPLLNAVSSLSSNNQTMFSNSLTLLSNFICGSENNDLKVFLGYFLPISNTRSKRSPQSCRSIFYQFYMSSSTFGSQMYQSLAPVLFGKIFYTPNSSFVRELLVKANNSFVILDELLQTSIQWRLNFRDWFQGELSNSSWSNNLRSLSQQCLLFNLSQMLPVCRDINNFLNIDNIQSMIGGISIFFNAVETILSCVELDKFIPVTSPAVIDQFTSGNLIDVFAGLVFDPSFNDLTRKNATFLNYTIRMARNRIDSTTGYKVLDKFWTPIPRTNTFSDMKYYTSGFLVLQEALDRAFIEMVTGNKTVDVGSSIQIMPSPCYVYNGFIQFATSIMPFIFLIAWLPSFAILIKSIVYEKEKRLKEFMLVMGLSHSVHWTAWFIISVTMAVVPITIISIILRYRNVLEFSSPAVVFLLFLSFVVSFTCQAFLITVFFNKANIAAVFGGLLYFILYVPALIFSNIQDNVPVEVYFGAGILSQVAFCNGLSFIAFWEQNTEGAQFENLFQGIVVNVDFGVGHCIIMLWVDAVIYLLIALYVEAVFPGQFGIPKKWYYFVTKRYWFPNYDYQYDNLSNDNSIRTDENSDDTAGFEAVSSNLKVGISIRNLTKKFTKMSVPSVDNLNLDFYKSQITAFLGHNGAGKTTTISILTGLFPPSSGTAYIFNEDIRTNIDTIRKVLGLCPQHNILFDNLTVEDHIYFYGRLRGMSSEDIKLSLSNIIEEVGLTKKRITQSKKLSGGMKRKLSVALAFLGDSKVIFLDEPTAGVDPFARRGIWDLLIKYRSPEKVIILTTHHMDEADYLSDRIAIISHGKLKCCGSSIFLKRHYGDGYYLIFVKSSVAQQEIFNVKTCSESGDRVLKFVRKNIEKAEIFEETSTQLTILLPAVKFGNNDFSTLFENLDNFLDILNVTSYGLSDTSLEDVFLKVADDPSNDVHPGNDDRIVTDVFDSLTENGNLPRPKTILSIRDKSRVYKNQRVEREIDNGGIGYDLLSGMALIFQQILALHIKKFHYSKRNVKGVFCELILPLLMVTLTVGLLKTIDPFSNQPRMIIHPWLMMPKARGIQLNTFYKLANDNNTKVDQLINLYRSDLGESGVRCMNRSVYFLENLNCITRQERSWSPVPVGLIPAESPSCDCNKTGYQLCSNPLSGGPLNSYRTMASTDLLNNLNGYNISDYLIKTFNKFTKKRYGGFEFLLPNAFAIASRAVGNLPIWNNTTATNGDFLAHLQKFFRLSGVRISFSRIWVNTKGYVSMPAYANLLSNILLRSQLDPTQVPNQYGIAISSQPFRYSQSDLQAFIITQMYLEMTLAIFVIFALSIIPASFVIFLIEERMSGSKRLQFVSGVNPYLYWVTNFFSDALKYVVVASLIVVIFVAFNSQSYIGSKNVNVFLILLYLYGLVIIPHMYPFSFLISTPSTAFVVLCIYNMIVGAMTTTVTFFLDSMQYQNPNLVPLNNALKLAFLIFPQYDLGRGMMDLSINYLSFNVTNDTQNYDPFSWEISGKKMVSLGSLFVFWSIIVVIMESGIVSRLVRYIAKNFDLKPRELFHHEDSNVAAERERVQNHQSGADILRTLNLTKIYNAKVKCCKKSIGKIGEKRKLAVNAVSFGVGAGECFGLLGVNGAGKTTIFKMLTGEEPVTKGEATINGKSIINDMVNAHKSLGFCPQFDALHSLLTCEEELFFYCRIRGIKSSLIKSTVDSSIRSLSLVPHASKSTHHLSGGNKRKLSTAISLVGNPKVVLMDEPTSGMDPGARRFLWERIRQFTKENRAVILTSHNMEECEVLCHRLAIMINGQFKCLGSIQELKSKFGDDYYVTVRVAGNDDVIKEEILKEFKRGISLKDENSVTIQFKINPLSYKLCEIFKYFEEIKARGIIDDFSVSQATLDDIFINFAKNENSQPVIINNSKNEDDRNAYDNPGFEETIPENFTRL